MSRSPSVPRQDEPSHSSSDKESGVRPPYSRPSTLERKHNEKTSSSLRFRSQSQSRVDAVRRDSLYDNSYQESQYDGSSPILHSRTVVTHDSKHPPYLYGRDNYDYFSGTCRDSILRRKGESKNNDSNKRLTIPQSSCESGYYDGCFIKSDDIYDITDPVNDRTNIKILERDLLNLITKLGQRHGEAAKASVDEPPPYEATVTPKIYRSTTPLVSTPSSLSSSRRSSRDLTNIDGKKLHKKLVRK